MCLTTHDTASLCVPGGSSPGETFGLLSAARLDWPRVHVFLGDERWVPLADPRSNTALLGRTLLQDQAAAAVPVPMITDAPTPEEGIADLLPGLAPEMPISVLLLGMGTDGHTASLFPDGSHLAQAMAPDASLLMPMRAPSQDEARVTLTAPALAGAMTRHILVMGDDKRDVLMRARGGDPMAYPIAAFLDGATVHWAP
jgi:6-phosphogluconolactonase